MTFRAGIGLALILVALALPARAEDAGAEGDAGIVLAASADDRGRAAVSVTVTRTPDGYEVNGRCTTEVSRAAAWKVLTDYDAIDRFVSSMRESRVTERTGDHLLVEQTAVGRLLFFSRKMTVVLFVSEEPESAIHFDDVLRRDFAMYRGTWRIEDRGGHREILYRVSARPAFRVPDLIARGMFGRAVRDLLSQVETEMTRREGLAAAE